MASDDNWNNDPAVAAAEASTGAFALAAGSKDAALLLMLAPGSYTVVVGGMGIAVGIALIETYDLP